MGDPRLQPTLRARRLTVLAVAFLLAGCAAGASPTAIPREPTAASAPSAAVITPTSAATPTMAAAQSKVPTPTAPAATAEPSPAPLAVVETLDIAYESTNPLLAPGVLDVYAPATAGPWPVVVMFHPDPAYNSKGYLREYARRVADLGFVAFVPAWGQMPDESGAPPTYTGLRAVNAQAACAVAFARAHAVQYGGNPATMIVFGHSAGAERAAMVAFARQKPSAGCLGSSTLGAIDALVTYEGDWILGGPLGNALDTDPTILDVAAPWKYLPGRKDLKVVVLVSSDPGIAARAFGDPKAAASWVAARDPSGVLRKQLDANGALADGSLSFTENQQLLFSVLKAQGNPVSLDVMPGSAHNYLSDAGWKVFLAAFEKPAAHT
jgi:dienelactone hydrolase